MVTPMETCPNAGAVRVEAVKIALKIHFAFMFLLTGCLGILAQTGCLRDIV